jgi:two-component system chemotaxis sensor kinase CheA
LAPRKSSSRRTSKAEREFVSEAEEILDAIRNDVADLSDAIEAGREADPDLVNRLFRSAHSLKALAGLFRFAPIEELAHRLEDALDALRMGRTVDVNAVVRVIEEAAETFATLLECVGDAAALESHADAIADLTNRIRTAGDASSPSAADDLAGLRLDPSLLRALTEYEEHRLRENLRRGRHIVLVDAMFEILAFEEGLSELSAAIRESGELLSTLPAPGETSESQIRFSLLVATEQDVPSLISALDFPAATVESVQGSGPASASPPPPAAETIPAPLVREERIRTPEPADPELQSLKSISETVRVDIRKLDELMNLVGELVIQRGAIGELVTRLHEGSEPRIAADFTKVHKALDRKLRELQSAVLDVRMVPLRQVFEKISRVVRRMRRDLGKKVDLQIRGADTELDKLIVEALVDPLVHVARNALDHGIEEPETRRAAGKGPVATISIDAFQRGNHVVIAVRDDGRGIDPEALRTRAEAIGVVREDDVLSEKETLDLIFTPGVSTSAKVTETSGRGVGMDVVRENLTSLGGIVDVESSPGRGTTLSMTLPITLAIIQSLLVGVGRCRFAIPLNSVLETLLIERSEVQQSEGRELLNLRGEPLLLRSLASEFGLAPDDATEKLYVIVMGIGDQRIGLLVDRLEGQQDTVIKPILGPVQSIRGIAGATDLGDQHPVLVLDVSAFIEDAMRRREAA